MELRRRKQKLAITLFLVILASFSFAFTVIYRGTEHRTAGSMPPDTTVNPKVPLSDSVYRRHVYEAEKLIRQKQYDEALAELGKALSMRPDEPTVKSKIIQVKAMAAQQKKDMEEFARLIASADKYFSSKDYLNAKATYQLALNINPDDAYAKSKLNETMGYLRSQKAQNILYDVAVANADKFFEAGELDKAKAEYEKASQILPSDLYAKDRVNEIIKIQVDKQVREELYAQAITKGDQLYNGKKYQGALTEYKNALKQKPDEKYPQDRVKELTELLNELKALEEAYQQALAAADQLFVAKRYIDSKTGYQDALKIKPGEAYPKNRIREIDGILAGLQRTSEEYERYIALADSFYIDKNFVLARQNYQFALQMKPNEAYPKEMLSKTAMGVSSQEQSQKAMAEAYAAAAAKQKELDAQYMNFIATADKLYTAKSFEDARKGYTDALSLKPGEKYPEEQIAKIDLALDDIAKQKTIDEQYAGVVATADQLFGEKNYDESKAKYLEAAGIKPAEIYPKTKIAEIDGILAEIAKQKSIEDQYAGVIADADKLFDEKSYDLSKARYQSALALKPAGVYPKTRIAEIDGIFAEIVRNKKELDNQYASLIAGADKLFASKIWEEARKGYTDALSLKPGEKYPQEQIAKIDLALGDLAKQKAIDEQYAGVVATADQLFGEKKYDESKTKYLEAAGIKPAEIYPKTKIAEIDNILAAIAKQKSIDDQYAGVIADADKLFEEKSYDLSKASYQSALLLKPDEQYPKTRIAEIGGIFAENARKKRELDDQYNNLITGADKLYNAKTWEEARKVYTDALSLKPGEKYPQEQIAKIDLALGDLAKQKAIDEQYDGVVATADQLFGEKKYDESKAKYLEAAGIKPAETYPKTKIAEIDRILAEIAKQKSIDDQYAGVIADADKLFGEKSYDLSKAKYQSALAIKPAEEYPKTRIAEIDGIFAEIVKKKKELDDQYNNLIAGADKLFSAKAWETARNGYTDALSLKPGEKYPQEQIARIDIVLGDIAKQKVIDDQYAGVIASADRLFGEKKYDESKAKYTEASGIKPAESYPKTKIAEIDAIFAAEAERLKDLENRYNSTMANAGRLLAEKAYELSKAEYLKASGIKPEEQLPKDKITEINAILADIAAKKALDEQYTGIIASADQLFGQKKYDESKTKYSDALAVKPGESYPKTKITEIDTILAEIARQKALDENYAAAIAAGDRLFGERSFAEAKAEYQKALALKPAEAYPKTRIAESEKQINDIARQKAVDEQYAGVIGKADQLLAGKSYAEAKTEYQNALKMKAGEQYPKDRISEIDGVLAELARQKSIGDQYKAQVMKADQLFTAKQFELALTEYTAALAIKADEQYPKDRIAEIQGILAEMKAREDAYRVSVKNADQFFTEKKYVEARAEYQNAGAIKPSEQYPKDKISEISRILTEMQGKKVTYDNLLQSAGDLLGGKEYNKSKELYQQASVIFPEEAFPKERIAYITRTVDSIYRANKGQYDIAVANGDKYYTAFEFDKAIDSYTEASGYLPMESYPKEQIARIRRTIAENAIVDVLKTPVTIAAGDERKFPFEPVNIAARKDNFVYLRIRNLSEKTFNILMRYGKDAQANGGVVIRNVSVDGRVNERLISVRDQDLWYRADNNWISLFPQGGDIEVSFIQVSKVR